MPKYNKNQVTLEDTYKRYSKRVKDPVDYKTHKQVLELFGEATRAAIVAGADVKLFQGLSSISVRKRPKRTVVDHQASKQKKKQVLMLNTHSDFFGAFMHWKKFAVIHKHVGWKLEPCKKVSKSISEVMLKPGGHKRYFRPIDRYSLSSNVKAKIENFKLNI